MLVPIGKQRKKLPMLVVRVPVGSALKVIRGMMVPWMTAAEAVFTSRMEGVLTEPAEPVTPFDRLVELVNVAVSQNPNVGVRDVSPVVRWIQASNM